MFTRHSSKTTHQADRTSRIIELCLKECMMINSNNVKIYSYIVNVKQSADRGEYSRNLISETKHNK